MNRGFLPTTDPLLSLVEAFRPWEEVGGCLATHINSKKLCEIVDQLLPFPIDELKCEAEWWRVYCLLTLISHAYVWCEGDEGVVSMLPESLSIPWCTILICQLSLHMLWLSCITGMTATVTLQLSNWTEVCCLFSFTGSRDEEWFYIATVLVEKAAANGICEIPSILNNCDSSNNIGL